MIKRWILQVQAEHFAKTEAPDLKLIPWKTAVLAGRSRADLSKALGDPPSEDGRNGDLKLSDVLWHGRAIYHLTGSRAGFLALPSLLALVAASLVISAGQMAAYACSCGEPAQHPLCATPGQIRDPARHVLSAGGRGGLIASIHHPMEPWQKKFGQEVGCRPRLKHAFLPGGMQALGLTSRSQHPFHSMIAMITSMIAVIPSFLVVVLHARINFTQPLASKDTPRHVLVGEGSSGPVAEIHLDQRHVPRVAHVDVQGLRPSLDPTPYQAPSSEKS